MKIINTQRLFRCSFCSQLILLYSTLPKVHISKPSSVSENDEDELDDSDEERHTYKSFDVDTAPEVEDWQIEEPGMPVGVTPFLRGVIPAGKLRARTKPVGCQAYGLIQVRLMKMPFIFHSVNMDLPGVEQLKCLHM